MIDYPKCLYRVNETITVQDAEAEAVAKKDGYVTAAEHYGYDKEGGDAPRAKGKK